MDIRADRLRADIEANAAFGAVHPEKGRGRTVLTGTTADREAREHLVERLEAADLDVRVDAVGNVAGRWTPASADPDAPPVAAGSHLDSVPAGGIFDGPLGVYAALEAVRAIRESEQRPVRPVEVVSFTEEEGQRFGGGLVGSAVAAGKLPTEDALALEDGGSSLGAALDDIGFRGEDRLDASEWDAWLELHVEQAERLEREGVSTGVVTSIVGLSRCRVGIRGETNHAGTTPMDTRTDALAAASEFVTDVERAANEAVATGAETTVATVGKLDVRPNAPNVVPGAIDLTIDVRSVDPDAIDRVVDRARASLARLVRRTRGHDGPRTPRKSPAGPAQRPLSGGALGGRYRCGPRNN